MTPLVVNNIVLNRKKPLKGNAEWELFEKIIRLAKKASVGPRIKP